MGRSLITVIGALASVVLVVAAGTLLAAAVLVLMVLLSLAEGSGSAPAQPEWYPFGVLLLGLAGVAVGALWVGSGTRRPPAG